MKIFLKHNYGLLRKHISDSLKGRLSKFTFAITRKPLIIKDNLIVSDKFPNLEKGGLIISADFEMSWAWRYTKTGADYIQKGKTERANFPKIIKVLEEYNIPVTFATVGHLFLERCQKGEHDWMKRIPFFDDHWKFMMGDWFDHDPYSNFRDAPEWYASDLIKMIIDSYVAHEVSTHTFTHIDFSYKNCPADVARDEIKACIAAAKPYGVNLRSIVFPGGTCGNIEVLKEFGIEIYRKKLNFDLAYPFRDQYGLLVTPTSLSLEFNLNYGWSMDYYINRLKKYLDKAIKTNTIAHFWFHPSLNPAFIDHLFPIIFDYAGKLRDEGSLWIGTMETIAEHINKNRIL